MELYIGGWNPYEQIEAIPYSGDTNGHVELRRSGAEILRDDIMSELDNKRGGL